jgi:hypothetical protein
VASGEKKMSDIGDYFKAYKEIRKKKKSDNLENSLKILKENGITIEQLNQHMYRVDRFNFWPTTGKYYDPKTNEKGRGVFNLMKALIRRGQ